MALTAQQQVDCRRWAGYGASGNPATQGYRQPVFTNANLGGLSLDSRLASLSPEEENTLTTVFLAPLALREQEIQAASQNLDTESAAVWRHNQNEVAERRSLYLNLRMEMCAFLAIPPGGALGYWNRVVRA